MTDAIMAYIYLYLADAMTVIAFLRTYGLENDIKVSFVPVLEFVFLPNSVGFCGFFSS